MKKIKFENAEIISPAKVTVEGIDYEVTPAQLSIIEKYLSAETLNEMQDNMEEAGVVVSPTEPTTNEKVWIQRGKNLFNANNGYDYSAETYNVGYNIVNSNKIILTNKGTWSRLGCTVPRLKPNTQYTVSSNITNTAGLSCGLFSAQGKDIQALTEFKVKCTYTTDENGNLHFQFYSNFTDNNSTDEVVYDNIQIEEGSTATEYEKYIEKKIYVDGIEFLNVEKTNAQQNHSTAEQLVGTWIDGKPLYRRIVKTAIPTVTTDGTMANKYFTIENADNIIIEWAYAYFSSSKLTYPLPFFNSTLTQQIKVTIDNGLVATHCNVKSWSDSPIYVSILYTKTTD